MKLINIHDIDSSLYHDKNICNEGLVIYYCKEEMSTIYARPQDMFFEYVEYNDKRIQRFAPVNL